MQSGRDRFRVDRCSRRPFPTRETAGARRERPLTAKPHGSAPPMRYDERGGQAWRLFTIDSLSSQAISFQTKDCR